MIPRTTLRGIESHATQARDMIKVKCALLGIHTDANSRWDDFLCKTKMVLLLALLALAIYKVCNIIIEWKKLIAKPDALPPELLELNCSYTGKWD